MILEANITKQRSQLRVIRIDTKQIMLELLGCYDIFVYVYSCTVQLYTQSQSELTLVLSINVQQ